MRGATPPDELGAGSRALLDAARPALGPDADAARRMRAKIAIATASGGAGAAGIAGMAKLGIAAKLGIVAAVALVAGGIAVVAAQHRAHDAAIDAPPTTTATTATTITTVTSAPIVQPIAPPAIVVEQPSPRPQQEQEMPAVDLSRKPTAHPTAPTTTTPTPAIALAREVALLDQAMSSLRAHDATRALSIIKTYSSESAGKGQLAEDAAAIEVEALCSLHDGSAADHLATFDTRFPSSAQRTRLTQACRQ